MMQRLLTALIVILFNVAGSAMSDCGLLPFENSQFTTVDGIKIHYRIFEPDDDPSGNIVFIHGFAASTFSWRKNMEFFAEKGYRVLAVDMPGYGFSDKRKPFDHSHDSRARLTWKLLDSVSDEQWILAGHSMGGGTVGYMAAMYPDRTEKLVISNGTFGRMHRSLGRILGGFLIRLPGLYHLIEGMGQNIYINYDRFEPMLSSAYGEEADSMAVRGYVEPFKINGSAVSVFETFMRGFDEKQPELDKIVMPTLLVWGEHDTWVPVKEGRSLHSNLKNSEMIIIPDAGHNPMETHPDKFNEILFKFLSNSVE